MEIIPMGYKLQKKSACSIEHSIHRRSADPSLAEIHKEIRELFRQKVNAQKEYLKMKS